MTHPDYIREKAIELRRERGMTMDEIAERLALSRSTIYYWVKDIEIPRKTGWKDQSKAQKLGTKAMQEKFLRRRELAYNAARHSFYALAEDPSFRDFVSVYLCEGYKKSRNTVSVANSDPLVVELAHRWITKLTTNKVSWSIQYHADQNPEMLRDFWVEPPRHSTRRDPAPAQVQQQRAQGAYLAQPVRRDDRRGRRHATPRSPRRMDA